MKKCWGAAVLGGLVVLTASSPGRAQTAAAPDAGQTGAGTSDQINTVVVTAQKRKERLVDVPSSISVETQQDIEKKDLISLSDMSARMPNVQISGSSLYPAITIRGVSSAVSDTNPGFAPAAAVYVDDVYQGRDRATNIPLSGVQQIEVLRGPQGTLYGKDTIAGAINITTLKPGRQFVAFADEQYGNLGFEQLTGTVSGPITDDVSASASIVYRHRDGDIHNAFNGRDLGYDDAWGGRLRAIYRPTSNLTIDLEADYLKEDDTESYLTTDYSVLKMLPFPPYSTAATFNPRTRTEAVDGPEYGKREVHGFSARVDYQFGGVELTSISATRGYNAPSAFDTDGTMLNVDYETWANSATQFSQEFRLTSSRPGPFQWIAGAYYYHEKENSDFFLNVGDDFPAFLFGLGFLPPGYHDAGEEKGTVVEDSYAGFLSASYDITPRLRLAGGARFTDDQKNLHFFQLPVGNASPSVVSFLLVNIPPRVENLSEQEPSFDASLTYKFTPDQVGYIKFSRGYKAGGFNLFAITPPNNPNNSLSFRPEFLNNYEIGFKGDWWGGRLSVNAAGFYDDYTNKQEQVENTGTLGIIVRNAASARLYGAELEVDAVPLPGLTLSGTLGALHGTYVSFPDAGAANACNCFNGNRLADAPDLEVSLAADYRHDIPSWNGVAGVGRIEAVYQGSSFPDANNTPAYESEPFTLLNARVGLQADHWGFYLWGKNLTDVYHLTGGDFQIITIGRHVNLPRMFGLELEVRY
jgi:iron complex outermembrane recepter protein